LARKKIGHQQTQQGTDIAAYTPKDRGDQKRIYKSTPEQGEKGGVRRKRKKRGQKPGQVGVPKEALLGVRPSAPAEKVGIMKSKH